MAKPRVFISSTYYDLKDIRENLYRFVESLGFEPVEHERGSVPYVPDQPLDASCCDEVGHCDMLVLIIGSRYGNPVTNGEQAQGKGPSEGHQRFKSITKREYERARSERLWVSVLVEQGVHEAHRAWVSQGRPTQAEFPQVEDPQVFEFLDGILRSEPQVTVKPFNTLKDIEQWLHEQWAGVFAFYLRNRRRQQTLADMQSQLRELRAVVGELREYSKTIIRKQLKPKIARTVIMKLESATAGKRAIAELSRHMRLTENECVAIVRGSATFESFCKAVGIEEPAGHRELFMQVDGEPTLVSVFIDRLRVYYDQAKAALALGQVTRTEPVTPSEDEQSPSSHA